MAVSFTCFFGGGVIDAVSQAPTGAVRSERGAVSAATAAVRRFHRLELDGACLSSLGRARLGELVSGSGVIRRPDAFIVVTRLEVGDGTRSGPNEVSVPVDHQMAAKVDLTTGRLDAEAAGLRNRGLVKVIQNDSTWRIEPTIPCAFVGSAAAKRALLRLASTTDDAGIKARAHASARWLDAHGR